MELEALYMVAVFSVPFWAVVLACVITYEVHNVAT